MEIEKKHIHKSYKNEQDPIDSVEKIKDEKENHMNSTVSGYNVEKSTEKEYPTNAFSPGELDMGEPAFKDFEDDPSENPGLETEKKRDIERPLPERAINNRMR